MRNVALVAEVDDADLDDGGADGAAGQIMEGVQATAGPRCLVQVPEPLVQVPADLSEHWLAVVVPRGERCLVASAQGRTVSRRSDGTRMETFQSGLPAGSSGPSETQTYYVLDMLLWNGTPVHECEAEFR
ncbi:hypothetical protein HK105_202987 [Polyrhizophydium stewartii]|uniref:Snurportin-1 n=1 Tax=Polyrhizophydium stewartii TaxID=2732419 RepID=A0ABR4NCS4_9FUNG